MKKNQISTIGLIIIFFIAGVTAGIYVDSNNILNTNSKTLINSSEIDCVFESLDLNKEKISITYKNILGDGKLPMDIFAETGDTNGYVFHLWDLASVKPKNLPKIFEKSIDPNITDFRGNNFQGIVVYVKNLYIGKCLFTMYTGKIFDCLIGRIYSQSLTFQKRFYPDDNEFGESGINYWPVRAKEYLPMKIYMSPSLQDESINSLKIDYDVFSNKMLTQKPLIDEVRQIPGSDLYIGKMYFRILNKPILILWFAIELENYSS